MGSFFLVGGEIITRIQFIYYGERPHLHVSYATPQLVSTLALPRNKSKIHNYSTQGKESPPCTTLDLGHPRPLTFATGFPLKTGFPGFGEFYALSQPYLGQTGSNFGGINYMYGIFSGEFEVGSGIWKLLLKQWSENIWLDSSGLF